MKLIAVGAGMTRVLLYFGFMEHPDVMEGLRLACRDPNLRGIDPEKITFYSRRVMVVPTGKVPGMALWRERYLRRCTSTPICQPLITACQRHRWSRWGSKSRSERAGRSGATPIRARQRESLLRRDWTLLLRSWAGRPPQAVFSEEK